jgi:protein-disulfide isomerase
MSSGTNKPTRSEQRDAARAKAREMREQHKKGEKRKRVAIQASIGAVVLGIVAIIGFAIVSGGDKVVAQPTNMIFNDGIKIGANLEAFTSSSTPVPTTSPAPAEVPNIVVYIDYQCPICQAFEVPNKSQIESWVSSGAATLELHPISFLDGRGSPNEYSSRAANATVCVAEHSPAQVFKFNSVLFENQPEEGTAGPDNKELIARTVEVGVTNADKIASCISSKSFGTWVADATDRALGQKIPGTDFQVDGTPFILVNGKQYTWETGEDLVSPARFAQFVQSVSAQG